MTVTYRICYRKIFPFLALKYSYSEKLQLSWNGISIVQGITVAKKILKDVIKSFDTRPPFHQLPRNPLF